MSKELKALAEAATPGPWGWDGPVWGYDAENEAPWLIQERGSDVVITGELQCSEANAAYISAADPATVLSLIAERDALLAERDALKKDAARWRHARSILTVDAIETAQSEYINFGLPPAESESIRADQAIDAAMQGEQP